MVPTVLLTISRQRQLYYHKTQSLSSPYPYFFERIWDEFSGNRPEGSLRSLNGRSDDILTVSTGHETRFVL